MPTTEPKASKGYVYDSSLSLKNYYDFLYDGRGNLLRKITYTGPGDDGIWFNENDQVLYENSKTIYDIFNRIYMKVTYTGPGPGEAPLINDVVGGYTIYTYDSNGDIKRKVSYESPGSDGVWFNSNDIISHYTEYVFNYQDYYVRYTTYDGPGGDNVWFNGNDHITDYNIDYCHSNYKPYLLKKFSGSGIDGQWYTDDDVKSRQNECFYDAKWNLTKIISSETGGNVDEITYLFNVDNLSTRHVYKRNGSILGYIDIIYDEENRLKEHYSFYSSGNDQKWFTNDDKWSFKTVYEFIPGPLNSFSFIPLLLFED